MRQVLAWAVAHDAPVAVRLADALGSWWWMRSRLAGQYSLLREMAGLAEPGSDGWCAIQWRLGWAAVMAADLPGVMGHFTAARDAARDRGPSRVLADALASLVGHAAEHGPARRGGRGWPPRAGYGPGAG